MVQLRCGKCGSDSGFLVQTRTGLTHEVKKITTDRIKASVLVTCLYCNNRWDQVPVTLIEKGLGGEVLERFGAGRP